MSKTIKMNSKIKAVEENEDDDNEGNQEEQERKWRRNVRQVARPILKERYINSLQTREVDES